MKKSTKLFIGFVIIIAFAGIIATLTLPYKKDLTRGLKNGEILIDWIEPSNVQNEPNADNPLIIPQNVLTKRNERIQMGVGYYNKQFETAIKAKPVLTDCRGDSSNPINLSSGATYPHIVSIAQDVNASTGKGYRIILTSGDLSAGNYSCYLGVLKDTTNPVSINTGKCAYYKEKSMDETGMCYEKKQFFLQVTP